jgi:uncharacterized membrane protein YjgN (DUF898 family)
MQQSSPDVNYPVKFTGRGGEYFKIWIVNILLSIVTLYIYSAWAKVRTRRYFYGNTVLDNSAFEYHATGLQLLPGRLIAITLVAMIALGEYLSVYIVAAAYAFLILVTPWAVCRSTQFNARMTSYRNVRLGFTGKVGTYYRYLFLIPLVIFLLPAAVVAGLYYSGQIDQATAFQVLPAGILVVYLFWPWIHCRLSAYSIDNTRYGTAQFDTDLTTGRFFKIYLGGVAVTIMLIAALALIGAGIYWVYQYLEATRGFDLKSLPQSEQPVLMIAIIVIMYAIMIALFNYASAYVTARIRNYQYNRTLLDRRFQLSSTIKTNPLWWLTFTNLLMIIFTLGLAYPWAAVRKARFFAEHTSVISQYNADRFVADQEQAVSAYGEEFGDAFDMDIAAGM